MTKPSPEEIAKGIVDQWAHEFCRHGGVEADRLVTEAITAALKRKDWQIEVLREALEFYAARSEHHPLGGDRAREALSEIRPLIEGGE